MRLCVSRLEKSGMNSGPLVDGHVSVWSLWSQGTLEDVVFARTRRRRHDADLCFPPKRSGALHI